MNSNMAQKYIHYFGNESSESLLEAYGIVEKGGVVSYILFHTFLYYEKKL
jgi:hypothetical protein